MDFVEKPGDCLRNPSSSPKVNLMEERRKIFFILLSLFVCFSRSKVSFVVKMMMGMSKKKEEDEIL